MACSTVAAIFLATVGPRGPTRMQVRAHLAGDRLALDASWITALYPASLATSFAAYHASRRTA